MFRFGDNALYPSTTLEATLCGPRKVVHYENPAKAAKLLKHQLQCKKWFVFLEVNIRVQRVLARMGQMEQLYTRPFKAGV